MRPTKRFSFSYSVQRVYIQLFKVTELQYCYFIYYSLMFVGYYHLRIYLLFTGHIWEIRLFNISHRLSIILMVTMGFLISRNDGFGQ